MMKAKIRYLLIIFILSGCSTINFKGPTRVAKLERIERKKSLTVKIFHKLSSHIYWSEDDYLFDNVSDYRKNKTRQILQESDLFSTIEFINSPRVFIKKADTEGIQKHMEYGTFNKNTDLQLNMFTIGEAGHAYLLLPYVAWALVHVGTLGLVPLWYPDKENYTYEFRDRTGKILLSSQKDCSASIWSWSPFILSTTRMTTNQARDVFTKNCINSILADARNARIL